MPVIGKREKSVGAIETKLDIDQGGTDMSAIRPKFVRAFFLCLILPFFVGCEKKPVKPEAQKSFLRLATTTSTVDSALLGVLITIFESKHIWSIVEDITERKLAEGEIKQHLDKLQR